MPCRIQVYTNSHRPAFCWKWTQRSVLWLLLLLLLLLLILKVHTDYYGIGQEQAWEKTNLIYQFSCHEGDCELHNQTFIGLTTTTLSRRLTMHLSNGGPKQHTQNSHNINLTRESLVNSTNIICTNNDPYRLSSLEALYIRKLSPSINKQITSSHRTVKLFTS